MGGERQMFSGCTKLDVDLSNWDLTNIKYSLNLKMTDGSGITKNH